MAANEGGIVAGRYLLAEVLDEDGALKPVLRDLLRADPARRPAAAWAVSTSSGMSEEGAAARRLSRRSLLLAVGAVGLVSAGPPTYYFTRDPYRRPFARLPVDGENSVCSAAFSPDGRILAACDDTSVRLWRPW